MFQSSIVQTIFLTFDQVMVASALVPISFTEEDIVHYVMVEQAQLFPTLDQDIYFDFLITSLDEENKKITIVACNMKDISSCASTLQYLRVSHEEFNTLNLLPWRQREKKRFQQKQRRIIYITSIIVIVIMSIICLWFFYMAHHNKSRLQEVIRHLQEQEKKLTTLELSHEQYQQLQHVWKNYIEIAQQQEKLVKILASVESQRPPGLFLEEILWQENSFILKGYALNGDAVKAYITLLGWSHIQAGLKSLKNHDDKLQLVKFEIFIEELS